MSRSKCSRDLYCSFLDVTSDRYSALSLSEVAPGSIALSHDSISRWLMDAKVQPKDLWESAKKEVINTDGECKPGILAFDDVVIDKSRSGKTELVNWQYAGSKHDIVKGIGIVNALWQTSKEDYVPIDYRIWNPTDDGKTKNDHFKDMCSNAKQRGLNPEMVVADSWYSSLDNLKRVRSYGWDWVMGLRSNRLVGKPHAQIKTLAVPDDGLTVYLKGYGWIKLFRFVTKHSRTDYIGTSKLDLSREEVKKYFERRWSIEVLHRELKQTCGFARCLANTGRAQRNHIRLSLLSWIRRYKRRLNDLREYNQKISMYQQKWETIKPSIQLALEARMGF